MDKILIGLDPEFTRSGVSIFYNGNIWVTDCRTESKTDKGYNQVLLDVRDQVNRICSVFSQAQKVCNTTVFEVYSECAPPQGQFSSGLFALDVSLHLELMKRFECEIYTINPTYIGHLHGKRRYNKSEDVQLALNILGLMGIEPKILTGKKLNHDQADSLLFLFRGMSRNGVLSKEVLAEFPKFSEEREKKIEL